MKANTMPSTTGTHDYILLSDDKGQLYAIHRLRLQQFKIEDDEKGSIKKIIADNVTTNTTAYKILCVVSKDSFA